LVAGLPFFMVVASAFDISRWVLHLRQYASIFVPPVVYESQAANATP
jgi:hypothetical protein